MAVPDFQSIMLPVLKLTSDGAEHQVSELYEHIARESSLTAADRAELLPSGKVRVLHNRVAWARIYLVKAGLLEAPRRGVIRITERGRDVLRQDLPALNIAYLNRFPEFVAFRTRSKAEQPPSELEDGVESQTPEELLERAYSQLRATLAKDLLEEVMAATPTFFEQLVLDLLVAMGYGGTVEDAGSVTGGGADEGIDGVIKEDRLGLDAIYLQAKRWANVVGRPEIQKFVGALQGKRATKGVFVTTSSFTGEAEAYAKGIDNTVVLIDGQRLVELMIDFDIGVSKVNTYTTKRLDSDYFAAD